MILLFRPLKTPFLTFDVPRLMIQNLPPGLDTMRSNEPFVLPPPLALAVVVVLVLSQLRERQAP